MHFPQGSRTSGHKYASQIAQKVCCQCIQSIDRLQIRKRHIIDKHFDRTNVDDSYLFYPQISLRMVFETFRAKLRAGILERKIDHPSRRLIYYCPLDFVVGTFSIRHRWGFTLHETRYVRVVCSTLECHFCHCLVPTLIRTIFSGWRLQKISY